MDQPFDPSARPRQQHYMFAHRMLPGLVLGQWQHVRSTFEDGTAVGRLKSSWLGLGERLAPTDRIDPGSSLDVRREPLGLTEAFVIDFPAPVRSTEAAFAIIPNVQPPTRYFVIELGWNPVKRSKYWVLGEWNPSSHLNLGACGGDPGTNPAVALQDALARIRTILSDGALA